MADKLKAPPGAVVNEKEIPDVTPEPKKRAKRTKKTETPPAEKPAAEVKVETEEAPEKPAESDKKALTEIELSTAQEALKQLQDISAGVTAKVLALTKRVEELTKIADPTPAEPRRQATLLECNQEYFAAAKAEREAKARREEIISEAFGGYTKMRNPRTGEETIKKLRRNLR